jgi:hypothetical protein
VFRAVVATYNILHAQFHPRLKMIVTFPLKFGEGKVGQ